MDLGTYKKFAPQDWVLIQTGRLIEPCVLNNGSLKIAKILGKTWEILGKTLFNVDSISYRHKLPS